jgi:hypothetical protein
MTAPAAQLCQQCLAANVIATVGGPTCRCVRNYGVSWWPPGFSNMTEAERCEWIRKQLSSHERK